jgi:hypothetical protein
MRQKSRCVPPELTIACSERERFLLLRLTLKPLLQLIGLSKDRIDNLLSFSFRGFIRWRCQIADPANRNERLIDTPWCQMASSFASLLRWLARAPKLLTRQTATVTRQQSQRPFTPPLQ